MNVRAGSRPGGSALLLGVLAAGAFVLGTGELGVVGVLPAIAADLRIGVGPAGLLVTLYALGIAVGGPPMTAALARRSRRSVLLGGLALMAAANAATAGAPWWPVLLGTRAVAGAAAVVYVAAALTLAADAAGPARRGRAVAVVFAGVSVSGFLGVPAGTLLGARIGWRAVYLAVGALAGLVLLAAVRAVPAVTGVGSRAGLGAQVQALLSRGMPVVLASNAVVTAGRYAVFTYLAALLARRGGMSAAGVSTALLLLVGVA